MGEWRYSSTIYNLGIRREGVVSFPPWPLYPGREFTVPNIVKVLSGPQSPSQVCEENNFLAML
jgi:hypothetical protein